MTKQVRSTSKQHDPHNPCKKEEDAWIKEGTAAQLQARAEAWMNHNRKAVGLGGRVTMTVML